jgi:hypothetical protein
MSRVTMTNVDALHLSVSYRDIFATCMFTIALCFGGVVLRVPK